MAIKIDLELLSITENKDANGNITSFTAQVKAIRNGTGEKVGSRSFTGANKDELKARLRPLYEKIIEGEERKEQLENIVNQALQELMEEKYGS